jgi:hypothetical protein
MTWPGRSMRLTWRHLDFEGGLRVVLAFIGAARLQEDPGGLGRAFVRTICGTRGCLRAIKSIEVL